MALAAVPVWADETLEVRVMPDRRQIYAGDSMLVSVVLYASAPIAEAEAKSDFKVKGKCKVRKLRINRNATAGRTREGRKVYYTLVWNQYVVAPAEEGDYTIPAQKFKVRLNKVVYMPDLFDQMMGAEPKYEQVELTASSDKFTFSVRKKPLRSTKEIMSSGAHVM